jgi:PleD family two-component response regulator
VSAGVAFAGKGEEPTLDALLLLADKALYGAKNAGRNQVSAPQYQLAG